MLGSIPTQQGLIFMNKDDTVTHWDFSSLLLDDNGARLATVDSLYLFAPFSMAAPAPPLITRQPVSQTVAPGDAVSFSVEATGFPPLSYQWEKARTYFWARVVRLCHHIGLTDL